MLCAAGAALLAALAAASLFTGKYPLTLAGLLAGEPMQLQVFWSLRFSRTVVGAAGGFALGAAGFVYQTVFRNPLASPDVIGVSSGASAGAAAGILFLQGAAGVTLADGTRLDPAEVRPDGPDPCRVQVVLHQGVYHQIKRMFGVYGAGVNELHRLAIGPVALDPALAPGQWRPLTDAELAALRRSAGRP